MRWAGRLVATALAVVALGFVGTAPVTADPLGQVTTFTDGIDPAGFPESITVGPDGNLWFTEFFGSKFARITPDGVVTEFLLPVATQPRDIFVGPDGNLWIVQSTLSSIAIATTDGVVIDTISLDCGVGCDPIHATVGPDGNAWVTLRQTGEIARVTAAGVVTKFAVPGCVLCMPSGITSGPDGNIWFTLGDSGIIGTISTDGTFGPAYDVPTPGSFVGFITTGPDGNLWFTQTNPLLGRITPTGDITEFPAPDGPAAITTGPDGNLWVVYNEAALVSRVTVAGEFTDFPIDGLASGESVQGTGITAGPDCNVWGTVGTNSSGAVLRVGTGIEPGPEGCSTVAPPAPAPIVLEPTFTG